MKFEVSAKTLQLKEFKKIRQYVNKVIKDRKSVKWGYTGLKGRDKGVY